MVDDLDIVMTEQLADAQLLGGVVLDDEQTLAPRLREFPDPRERLGQALARRRLGDERKCAARQAMLTIFIERGDLDGNMSRQGIFLELAEDVPAQHVG